VVSQHPLACSSGGEDGSFSDQIGAVESVKAASDIVSLSPISFYRVVERLPPQYAPVSGTIQEVNEALNAEPGLMNKSPENKGEGRFILMKTVGHPSHSAGWLCKIKLSNHSEVSSDNPRPFLKMLIVETRWKN
jgi:glycine cleavage system H protein